MFLDGDQADRQGYGLPQAVMWLGNILPWMPSKSPVWIGLGYVKGDDFWHYRNEFDASIGALKRLRETPNVQVKFPLEFWPKHAVLKALYDRGLYELCWTCEGTVKAGHRCGRCPSCQTERAALWQLKFDGEAWADRILKKIPSPVRSKSK